MVFARCALPCSSLPTLPGAASAVLAASSCGGCSSRVWAKISKLSIRTDKYMLFLHTFMQYNGWLEGSFYSVRERGRRFDLAYTVFCIFFRYPVWFHNRVPGPDKNCTLRYNARVCICMYLTCIFVAALCCSLAAGPAAAVLLVAGAVCHRVAGDPISCCVFLDLIPVFSFSSFQNKFFCHVPLGSTVACTAWLYP